MTPLIPHAPRPRKGPRRISLLGSTGSVGGNTLDVLAQARAAKAFDFEIVALTAHRNAPLLAAQALAWRPQVAVIADASAYDELKQRLTGSGIAIAAGPDAVREAAARGADWTMAAIVGAAGLQSTLAAVQAGGVIALANKESLVCAGTLLRATAEASGAVILPVDSEHNAIFQVFDFTQASAIERLELTASGGPFRSWTKAEISAATPEQALKHPTWEMGAKITIDSATLMNKGLELIEAHYLFGLPAAQLSALVHPQSIVHSLVHYKDGSTLAHLGAHDMRIPIAHALAWPQRLKTSSARLDLAALGSLHFERADETRFPCLALARAALAAGGGAPCVLNAANEEAVSAFLNRACSFDAIAATVGEVLAAMPDARAPASFTEAMALDADARRLAAQRLARAA